MEAPSLRTGFYLTVDWSGHQAKRLECLLGILATRFGCEVKDLRLDHNPALATRMKRSHFNGKKWIAFYSPDANDPNYLVYREKHDHHIKTNVRGDGAQHPDRVLIKRERRRQRAESIPPRKASGFQKRRSGFKRNFTLGVNKSKPKLKSRSFQQMRCAIGARCFCDRQRRKRCGNYRQVGK